MQALALGFALLILVLLGGRWFATAQPATVLRAMRWGGLAVAVLVVLLVIRTGALPLIFAAFAALLPWLLRLAQLAALSRHLRGTFGGPGPGWRTAGANAGGDVSEVETAWLRMSLDHDSGSLEGEVLEGPARGRRLAELGFAELAQLWRDVQADAQSLQLLEAWLDRVHPDWRERMTAGTGQQGGHDGAGPAGSGGMSRDEALAVLGLAEGAGIDDIKAAHRRLMRACHPDHGGSDWLAARINRAKDLLLAEAAR